MLEEILFQGIRKPKERKKREIKESFTIEGEQLPKLESFDDLKTRTIFDKPRLVQQLVIPYVLNGKNVCVRSFTGSGKTLSYILPLLELGVTQSIVALILVPTEQLVKQIKRVIEGEIKGKTNSKIYIYKLTDLDKIEKRNYTHLVIDEADSMIDKDSFSLFNKLQNLADFNLINVCVFSATLTKEVENIIGMFKDITKIYVQSTNSLYHKFVCGTKDELKHLALEQVIHEGVETPCLVFVNKEDIGRKLSQRIPNSAFFNGQEEVLNDFRMKNIWFLFTTDVLSRGMDFINMRSVINYDFPQSKVSFIHRVGRINRNTTGQRAITIYTLDDYDRLADIVSVLKENGCKIEESIDKLLKQV